MPATVNTTRSAAIDYQATRGDTFAPPPVSFTIDGTPESFAGATLTMDIFSNAGTKVLQLTTSVSGLCVVALRINLKLTTTLDRTITQNPCYALVAVNYHRTSIRSEKLRFLKSLFFVRWQIFSIFGTKIIYLIISDLRNI